MGKEFLSKLGSPVSGDVAIKHNTASVSVNETAKIAAGGDVSVQADATVSLKMQSKTVGKKEPGSSTVVPVVAIAGAGVENKALVDIKGELSSTDGDVSLAASTDTSVDLAAKAKTEKADGDTGSAIYIAGAILSGDSLAEVNVADLAGENKQISAGGAFSAEATATSDIAVEAVSAGTNETFASTSVSVLDYDSAANVNLKRSVEAESISAKATSQVDSLGISADNGNGEGVDPMVEFKVSGDTNAGALAKFVKEKLGLEGTRQGGKLAGLENAFTTALQYITAGAAVGVVDNTNTSNVTVAPGVQLKATGPAVKMDGKGTIEKDKDGKPVPGGDVTLEAVTNMKSFSHTITGVLNKQQDGANEDSKVNVAAAFLYSNIDNDATVELQSKNNEGVTLCSENGSVNLKADVDSDDANYMSTLRGGSIVEAWDNLIAAFVSMGKDTKKLSEWKKETVEVQTQLQNGTIGKAEAATKWTNVLPAFGSFIASECKDLVKADANLQKLVAAVNDFLSPASYTNYYVRSYAINGSESGESKTVAASVNIADLENRGIIAIGEKSRKRRQRLSVLQATPGNFWLILKPMEPVLAPVSHGRIFPQTAWCWLVRV